MKYVIAASNDRISHNPRDSHGVTRFVAMAWSGKQTASYADLSEIKYFASQDSAKKSAEKYVNDYRYVEVWSTKDIINIFKFVLPEKSVTYLESK